MARFEVMLSSLGSGPPVEHEAYEVKVTPTGDLIGLDSHGSIAWAFNRQDWMTCLKVANAPRRLE